LLWFTIAGGVVDSPPTVWGNRVLFGCTDGWVTCLRVTDGALAWRFRAAPRDQRIVSYGEVQSSWPVHGSVLVKRGIAYVVAGRSSFLDGGLFLYGLDVATGAVRYQNRLDGPWAPAEKASPHGAHWMDGGLNDILVSSADKLYLMQNVFDLSLRPLDAPVIAPHGARTMERHLAATGGFLDTTGFDRIYWMHAELWPGLYYGYNAPKTGQILVFDHDTTYALHTFAQRFSRSPYFAHGRDGYDLVADDNTNEPYLDPKAARHEREPGYSRKQPPTWKVKTPIRVVGMVLAADTLFLAGPPDKIDTADPLATFEGRGHAVLAAVSTRDGSTRAEYVLAAQPVFDGLIAASGRLFISARDGRVLCFGETRKP
jgi:outer membrane protein assembly factor BamB